MTGRVSPDVLRWGAEQTVRMHGKGRCAQCPDDGSDCPGLADALDDLQRLDGTRP